MRVLMTTDTVGGVWTFTRELAGQLLSAGHAVAVVSFGRDASREQRMWCSDLQQRYGNAFLYEASRAPLEWMNDNQRAYEIGERELLKIARRFGPDVLHCNQYCFGRLPVDIPRLITAHSDVLSWADACRPTGLEDSAWLDQYCQMVQDGLDEADCVVAPTAWMVTALKEHFDLTAPVRVVYNGRTVPQSLNPPHRFLRAISVGRMWDEAKGLTTLMQVKAPMPVMVAGEENFDGAAAPAPSRLQALGSLEEDALFAAFRSSSIYIAASRYEPFGLAPLEAALCGCSVVARDIPSLREVWEDAATYFGDAGELQRMLTFLAEDGTALRNSQLAAMERARRYTAEQMAAAYCEIYEALVFEHCGECPGAEEYVSHAA